MSLMYSITHSTIVRGMPILHKLTTRWQSTLFSAFSICALSSASNAFGQPEKDTQLNVNRQAPESLEEVVVTARRRNESMQDVPVSVSAFSGMELEDAQIRIAAQLAEYVPNLTFHTGAPIGGSTSTGSIYIRGVGSNEVSMGTEPGVGLYVDDVYIARSVGSVLALADIQSVQVLRGPQGTLFGRNSVGGAIVVQTEQPQEEFGGSINLTVGNDDLQEILATLNLPISESLRSRFSVLATERDGFVNNLDGGDDLGGQESLAGRGILDWEINEAWSLTLSADATSAKDTAVPSVLLGLVPEVPGSGVPSQIQALSNLNQNCGGASVLEDSGNPYCIDQQYIVGAFDGFGGYLAPNEIFDSQGSERFDNKSNLDIFGTSLRLEWNPDENLTFRSITAWRELDGFWSSNSDHSPNPGAEAKNDYEQEQFSQEFQLLGSALSESLDWIIGAYYLQEEGENLNIVNFPAVVFRSGGSFDTSSLAMFAQGSYSITDSLEWTLGVRYTEEKKEYDTVGFQEVIGLLLNPVTGDILDLRDSPFPFVTGDTPDLSFYEVSPAASLSWRLTENLMAYLSYSEGYKSGGYEQRLGPDTETVPRFEPEYSEVVELGIKSALLDGQLTANAAIFHNDYSGLQISVTDGVAPTLTNAGDATIVGAEAEIAWKVAEGTRFDFSLGWLDADYDELTQRAVVSGVSLENMLPNISEWQTNVSVSHRFDLAGLGQLTPRLDWSWRSEYAVDAINTPLLVQEDLHIINASLSFKAMGDQWSVVLAGRNLTDEEYLVSGLAQYSIGQIEGQYARPREWSLSVKYEF